jgi:Holliday junction resolvase RusA-like endonuclease
MSDAVSYAIWGKPEPKGSTRAFRRGAKIITTSDNPRLKGWASLVIDRTVEVFANKPPFEGPVSVRVVFQLARPGGHFGKRGLLPSAPAYPAGKPDLDKLVRGLLDGITQAGVWRDDARVVAITATKEYVAGDAIQGAIVTIAPVQP